MSYSFQVRAASREAAKAAVAANIATIVAAQPAHEADQAQTMAAASAFIDLLADDPTRDVVVIVNVATRGADALESASLTVGAGLSDKL